MSDTAGTSAPMPLTHKSRGANPTTDYKSLFLKSKDKYDRVSTDHTDLKVSVVEAAAKHQKLREELDYLLDAVAAKRDQRAQIEQSHRERVELERQAAAMAAEEAAITRARQSRNRERDREMYGAESASRAYEGGEEYGAYAPRYTEPSYHAFGSGRSTGYNPSPPPPMQAEYAGAAARGKVAVPPQRAGEKYQASEGSPQGSAKRGSYATSSYRQAPLRSPPVPLSSSASRRQYEYDSHSSSPSKYDAHQRYRESTPPLASASASSAIKRPRPTSVEQDLLEADEGYHSKRARND